MLIIRHSTNMRHVFINFSYSYVQRVPWILEKKARLAQSLGSLSFNWYKLKYQKRLWMKSITLFNRHFLLSPYCLADPLGLRIACPSPTGTGTSGSPVHPQHPTQQPRWRRALNLCRINEWDPVPVPKEFRMQYGGLASNTHSNYHSWLERSAYSPGMKEGVICSTWIGSGSWGWGREKVRKTLGEEVTLDGAFGAETH